MKYLGSYSHDEDVVTRKRLGDYLLSSTAASTYQTKSSAFVLGTDATNIEDGTDLNDCRAMKSYTKEGGDYSTIGHRPVNLAASFKLVNISGAYSSYFTQIYYHQTGSAQRIFVRRYNNGIWTDWQEYAFKGDLDAYQPLATAINTGNIANQSVSHAGTADDSSKLGGRAAADFYNVANANLSTVAWTAQNFTTYKGMTFAANTTQNASALSAAGWYRVAVSNRSDASTTSFRLVIARTYNAGYAEFYVLEIGAGFTATAATVNNTQVTQLLGNFSTQLIPRIRIAYARSASSSDGLTAVDIEYSGSTTANNVAVWVIGSAAAQKPTLNGDTPTRYRTVELLNGSRFQDATIDGVIKIGSITLKEENGLLHVVGGMYADDQITAGGIGTGGGGGGDTIPYEVLATDANLNNYRSSGFYVAPNANSILNRPLPSSTVNFGMIVIKRHPTSDYVTQLVYYGSSEYMRRCTNGTWSAWVDVSLKDTYSKAEIDDMVGDVADLINAL